MTHRILFALLLFVFTAGTSLGQASALKPTNDLTADKDLDLSKRSFERTLEKALVKTGARKLDTTPTPKKRIELPVKRTLANSATTFKSPQVAPGKVRWHADFSQACQAAKKSGKPVLLFHMIGKLTDRFC